jgi:hypothetical protein
MVGLRSLANTVHTNTVEQLAADISPVAASAIELNRYIVEHMLPGRWDAPSWWGGRKALYLRPYSAVKKTALYCGCLSSLGKENVKRAADQYLQNYQ